MFVIHEHRVTCEDFEIWKSLAPPSLWKYTEEVIQNPFGMDGQSMFDDLKKEIPDEKALILQLFELYGDLFTPWSGFPVYQMLPAIILMKQPIKGLNQAFQEKNLSPEHKQVIARFVADCEFRQKRSAGVSKVHEEVKPMLVLELG